MTLTVKEGQQIALETNDHLIPCPCCRRYVDELGARSIFNFNIQICKRCAHNEKIMPNDNWTVEENES